MQVGAVLNPVYVTLIVNHEVVHPVNAVLPDTILRPPAVAVVTTGLPLLLMVPLTSNAAVGAVVPIPTLPPATIGLAHLDVGAINL